MFIAENKDSQLLTLPAIAMSPSDAKSISSALAIKIIKVLASEQLYPIQLAKKLKVHEQKIYYHIRNLEKIGLVKKVSEENKHGAVARYYKVEKPAIAIKFKELEPTKKIYSDQSNAAYLKPFISDGKLDALIVVGSPDPHGPDKARSRDGYYGMDLALFLGTYLSYVPKLYVKLDTELRDSERDSNNLILIGGPVVNKITGMANSKLPIFFSQHEQWAIKSSLSNTVYPSDESGLIIKFKSPFNPSKSILLVAGKRYSGTRAAIVAMLKHFNEICSGNLRNNRIDAKVVEGIDLDSDGIIDDAEIRE